MRERSYISEGGGSEKAGPCSCAGTAQADVVRWKAVASFKRLLYSVKIKINPLSTFSNPTQSLLPSSALKTD